MYIAYISCKIEYVTQNFTYASLMFTEIYYLDHYDYNNCYLIVTLFICFAVIDHNWAVQEGAVFLLIIIFVTLSTGNMIYNFLKSNQVVWKIIRDTTPLLSGRQDCRRRTKFYIYLHNPWKRIGTPIMLCSCRSL